MTMGEMNQAIAEAYIDAAREACDAIEDVSEESAAVELDPGMVAVLAARLLTEGDRDRLLGTSKTSQEILTDEDIQHLLSELDEDDDEDDDE